MIGTFKGKILAVCVLEGHELIGELARMYDGFTNLESSTTSVGGSLLHF